MTRDSKRHNPAKKKGTLDARRNWDRRQVLNDKGARSLAQLKKEVKSKSPLLDWAIGWLAREDKIVITPEKRGLHVQLEDTQTKTASG